MIRWKPFPLIATRSAFQYKEMRFIGRVCLHDIFWTKLKLNSVAIVRERTIPTERPPPVGEVSANFCGYSGVTWLAQRVPTAVNLFSELGAATFFY